MSLENSPSLDDYQGGMPARLPDAARGKRLTRLVILGLLVIVLIFAILNFVQSETGGILAGRGSLSGIVMDTNNQPIPAEVFLVGSQQIVTAGPDGRFELKYAPAGEQTLVVAYQYTGRKYSCTIQPGAQVDLGILYAPEPGKFGGR